MASFTKKVRLIYLFLSIFFIVDLYGLFYSIRSEELWLIGKKDWQSDESIFNPPILHKTQAHFALLLVFILILFVPLERYTRKQIKEKKEVRNAKSVKKANISPRYAMRYELHSMA